MTTHRFRKNDIDFHADRSVGHVAINIKVDTYMPDLFRKYRAPGTHEASGDTAFWEWLDAAWEEHDNGNYSYPNMFDTCWEWACEGVYEQVKEHVCETMGLRDREVWQEGRSGGWMVADFDRSDVEDWDAIMVSRWGRCVRHAENAKSEVGYQTIWNLRYNMYDSVIDNLKSVDILGALV